jgi:chromosome segregation ATPase
MEDYPMSSDFNVVPASEWTRLWADYAKERLENAALREELEAEALDTTWQDHADHWQRKYQELEAELKVYQDLERRYVKAQYEQTNLIKELESKLRWYTTSVKDAGGYLGSLAAANKELEAEAEELAAYIYHLILGGSPDDIPERARKWLEEN